MISSLRSLPIIFLLSCASFTQSFCTNKRNYHNANSSPSVACTTESSTEHDVDCNQKVVASSSYPSRRSLLFSPAAAAVGLILARPKVAAANRFVLNYETGDYDEVVEEKWQTTWNQRLEKAKSMGVDEVFNAARGAGNLNLREGEESDSSKRRRALSACRDSALRKKVDLPDEKACTSRVLGGDFQFLIDAMQSIPDTESASPPLPSLSSEPAPPATDISSP
mmetsp:Transcript_25437/g.29328  ORF Transcript_25437/g.29328 Transcript_25437/m.29328 type:complete len:223 (-) Transcript_25437:482-1150(-)